LKRWLLNGQENRRICVLMPPWMSSGEAEESMLISGVITNYIKGRGERQDLLAEIININVHDILHFYLPTDVNSLLT